MLFAGKAETLLQIKKSLTNIHIYDIINMNRVVFIMKTDSL